MKHSSTKINFWTHIQCGKTKIFSGIEKNFFSVNSNENFRCFKTIHKYIWACSIKTLHIYYYAHPGLLRFEHPVFLQPTFFHIYQIRLWENSKELKFYLLLNKIFLMNLLSVTYINTNKSSQLLLWNDVSNVFRPELSFKWKNCKYIKKRFFWRC